jgi:hypothetical protein
MLYELSTSKQLPIFWDIMQFSPLKAYLRFVGNVASIFTFNDKETGVIQVESKAFQVEATCSSETSGDF